MEIKDYTNHKPRYVLPAYVDAPMYTTNVHDGYYTSSGVAVKEQGNTVHIHRVKLRTTTNGGTKEYTIIYRYQVTVPSDHKILHIAVSSKPESLVFHTDGKSLYVTASDFESTRQHKFSPPSEVRVFNTAMAMKQRTGDWMIIGPQLPDLNSPSSWVRFDSATKLRDYLRERSFILKKEYGNPIFTRVAKYMSTTTRTGFPTSLIITDKQKVIISHSDEQYVYNHLDDFFNSKNAEDMKDLRVAMTLGGEVAFQFDNGLIYAFHDNFPDLNYRLVKVADKGRLVENDNRILVQDGDKLTFPTTQHELDLSVNKPIVSISELASVRNNYILADNEGGFYLATVKGKKPDEELFKVFERRTKQLLSEPYPVYNDTFRQLVKDIGNVLTSLKMCE